jgi:hypothetical protein
VYRVVVRQPPVVDPMGAEEVIYMDNGTALHWEEGSALCRFYSRAPTPDCPRPPYDAVCNVERWTSKVCELRGFNGNADKRSLRMLTRALLDRGYEVAYFERPNGQGLDHAATRLSGGDFDGLYRLDLSDLASRLRIGDDTSTA